MATQTIDSVSTIHKNDTVPEFIEIEETVPEIIVCNINPTRWRN